jgi:hypothetical protein
MLTTCEVHMKSVVVVACIMFVRVCAAFVRVCVLHSYVCSLNRAFLSAVFNGESPFVWGLI